MVKTYTTPGDAELTCTSCGVEFQSPASPRTGKITCPNCREIIVIENLVEPVSGKKERYSIIPEADTTHKRTESLEARVAAIESAVSMESQQLAMLKTRIGMLESALSCAGECNAHGKTQSPTGKFEWFRGSACALPDFSSEQGRALAHNLRKLDRQRITLRSAADDPLAQAHSNWFKTVFDVVGWTVRGPENAAVGSNSKSLLLGVPELPVSKEAAETYLALKAAGFEPVPVLDPTLVHADGVASLSLTVPSASRA